MQMKKQKKKKKMHPNNKNEMLQIMKQIKHFTNIQQQD